MNIIVRKARGEWRREQILEAAARIVGEKGYHGFGIQELAKACGLSNAGLLHHFPSKDEVLIAVLRERDRRDADAVSLRLKICEPSDSGDLSLEVLLRSLRAAVIQNSQQKDFVRLYAVLRAEALNRDHPAHRYFDEREAGALELFERLFRPFVSDPAAVARHLLALMHGLELQWLREEFAFDLVAEWDRQILQLTAFAKQAAPIIKE
ncbi:TetR/AcrR family transcriptional regulator [Novosphingobium sp. Chol11]|uniref:TetR/AcrR family transcriptional regulator n=1 Tax=Novosphingobium sp. Chol11 TaxID=1385763 RepID=UPI000BE2BC32|nr:TetR/AcrR family transcriptional regulator [Novosphingobium sp. Chol11]